MIALYHLIVWSGLLLFTALCAQPPNPISVAAFYVPCQEGLSQYYQVNRFNEQQGHHLFQVLPHHEFLDLDTGNYMTDHMYQLDNSNNYALKWFDSMSILSVRTNQVIHSALGRLTRFIERMIYAISHFELPPEWRNQAISSRDYLQQCYVDLLFHAEMGLPPPNLQMDALDAPQIAHCDQLPDPTDLADAFIETCRNGVTRLYALYWNALPYHTGVLAQHFQLEMDDENLNFPYVLTMLQNVVNVDALWFNRLTSLIAKSSDVINCAIRRMKGLILWTNRAAASHVGFFDPHPLPAVLRNEALATNSQLVRCTFGLERLLVGHLNDIDVIVDPPYPEEPHNNQQH